MTPKEISDEYLSLCDKIEKIGHLIVHDNIKKACFLLGSLHSSLHSRHLECLKIHESNEVK